MHPYHDQLPVDLIAQLVVEHCTRVTEVKLRILLRYEFLSLQFEPLQIFCTDCLVSQTRLSFEGNVHVTRMTHERKFRVHEAKNTATVSTGVVEQCVYEWFVILSESSSN